MPNLLHTESIAFTHLTQAELDEYVAGTLKYTRVLEAMEQCEGCHQHLDQLQPPEWYQREMNERATHEVFTLVSKIEHP